MNITETAEETATASNPHTQAQTSCAVCNSAYTKYTCPRCELKSCSLACSTAHKQSTGCSGLRNKAAYVPMNAYGYGALMNDYVFLEEIGRQVEGWGREITRGGIMRGLAAGRAVRGMRGSASGRGRGRGGAWMSRQKMDRRSFLAMQLGFRDVDMDVLPQGMERAKRNQSHWDSKYGFVYSCVFVEVRMLTNCSD